MHRIDNPTVPIAYTSEPEVTMLPVTGLTDGDGDGIPDELEPAVAGDIGGYCGAGGVMGDADGDGISNDIEVRLGLECRMGEPGSTIAQAGEISLTVEDLAPGAIMLTTTSPASTVLIPGTDEMTGINLEAVDCAGCSSIRAYQVVDSGRSPLRGGLGSFSTRVMWVGMSDNNPIAVIGRKIYVAPPVGFDVDVVSLSPEEMSDDLPISIAVSRGAGNFSVGDLVVSGGTLASRASGLEKTGSSEQLSNRIRVTGISVDSAVVLTSVGGSMFSRNDNSLPQDLSARLMANNLFSIGNPRVSIIARPPVSVTPVPPEFTVELPEAVSTRISSISVPELTTVRSGIHIPDRDGGEVLLFDRNSAPLMTEVIPGVMISTETGVFDYAIELEDHGDIAVVLLILRTPALAPSPVYKFDATEETWSLFIATNEGDTKYDRVYSAPLTDEGECPGLGVLKQPDSDLSGGNHEYAWNLAVLEDNLVRAGDQCLLVQILDGSMNDADGGANGTIHDPIGLVPFGSQIPNVGTSFIFTCTAVDESDCSNKVRFTPSGGVTGTPIPMLRVDLVDRTVSSLTFTLGTDPEREIRFGSVRVNDMGLIAPSSDISEGREITVGATPSGGGAMEPIWLILLALAMILPYGLRRRQSSPFISDL